MTEHDPTRDIEALDEETIEAEHGRPARLGRKRDHTRDAVILDAALDVLAEVGFDGMTMDMVARRAKAGKGTVYRRWPSKSEMILGAVARMEGSEVDLDRLPDTGTLRGDLVAMIRPSSLVEGERRLKVMAGLASMMSRHRELAEAGNAAVVEPWVGALRLLMARAVERGEVPASADVETVSRVIPSMAAYRVFIQRKPLDRDFLVSLIDGVVLPALRDTLPAHVAGQTASATNKPLSPVEPGAQRRPDKITPEIRSTL